MTHDDEVELRRAVRRLQGALERARPGSLAPETRGLLDDLELRLRRLERGLPGRHECLTGGPARRANGWGRGLYRDREHGWLAGVCAGVARSLDVQRWLVRLVVLALAIVNPLLTLLGYLAAMALMAHDPGGVDDAAGPDLPRPAPRVSDVARRFDALERRLRDMEGHVTSSRFSLRRELADLERH